MLLHCCLKEMYKCGEIDGADDGAGAKTSDFP